MSGPVARPSTKKASGMRRGAHAWSPEAYPNWMLRICGVAPSDVSRKTETISASDASPAGSRLAARGKISSMRRRLASAKRTRSWDGSLASWSARARLSR